MTEAVLTIRKFISEATDIPLENVISARESSDEPEGLYAKLQLLSETTIGLGSVVREYRDADGDFSHDYRYSKSLNFSVHFFKEGAYAAAGNLQKYTVTELGRQFFWGTDLTWRKSSEIENLTDKENFIEKAGLNVEFWLVDSQKQETGSFVAAEVNFNVGKNEEVLNVSKP